VKSHAFQPGQRALWQCAWGKPLLVTISALDGFSPQGEPEYLVHSEKFDTQWSLGESVIKSLPPEPTPDLPPLIGLIGRMGVGKDTAGSELVQHYGFARVAFAGVLKDLALDINPIVLCDSARRLVDVVDAAGWDGAKANPEVRRFLQRLGDRIRVRLGDSVWVDRAMAEIAWLRAGGDPVVITDVRYANEAEAVRAAGGTIIKITRPDQAMDGHPSESGVDSIDADFEIINDTSLENFLGEVNYIADLLNLHDYIPASN